MSYRFANDLFISYAHIDNLDGWVEKFQERLQHRLAQLGMDVTIWRDKKLSGADRFSDEIYDQLKQSALLVSIVSPSGIRSNWCQDERQKFEQYSRLTGGFQVGNAIRAIKVVKTPLEGDAHRSLFNTLGYEFYARDQQSGRFYEHLPAQPEYERKLDELAQEVKEILQKLRPLPAEASKPGVYVATTSSDLESERNRVVQQLTDWGFPVCPSTELDHDAPDLRQTINSMLATCAFSVHLVSDKRGAIPESEEKPVPAVQYELADARHVERIVWVKPGSQPHASFEAALAAGSQTGLDRLEGASIETLKEVLATKLNGLKECPAEPTKNGDRLHLYVVCDRKDHPYLDDAPDRENALKLKSFLESKGFSVWHPPVSVKDKRDLQRDHRETLKASQAVVLYWGAADEVWFRENLRELEAARIRRRNRPFAAEAIYFSQPPACEKAQYRNSLSLALDEFNGFHPDGLKPLLDRLRVATEG